MVFEVLILGTLFCWMCLKTHQFLSAVQAKAINGGAKLPQVPFQRHFRAKCQFCYDWFKSRMRRKKRRAFRKPPVLRYLTWSFTAKLQFILLILCVFVKVIDSAMKIVYVIRHFWLIFIVVLLQSSCDWQWWVVEFVLSFSLNLIMRLADQHTASSVGNALLDAMYDWHGSYWTKSNYTRFSMCFLMCFIIGPLMSGAYPFYATSPWNFNIIKETADLCASC
jgi:hypothetical protein